MLRPTTTAAALALASLVAAPALAAPDSAHHGRGTTGIFWFVHLSDSHIGASLLVYPNATAHFEFALNDGVSVVDPTFVVVSGDLVDGSAAGIPTSGQEQAEWDTYRQTVDQAGMTTASYFDLPGNHDCYNDIGLNFYLANSLQGQTSGSVFHDWVVETPVGETYVFGLNSAGNGSGPGVLEPEGDRRFTPDEITALEAGLAAHESADLVIALGHHPLSGTENGEQVMELLASAGGAYYLHGHRHAYSEYLEGSDAIVANEVHTLGKSNIDNFGIGVVDHNGFVYRARDIVSPWPFVIITTPMSRTIRDSSVEHPYAYDICLDRPDNPFRAVVFAPGTPSDVTVEVGTLGASAMSFVAGSGAIWQAEVDTSTLAPGPYDVTVTALVGSDVGQHTISAVFAPGPCDELPDSDIPVGGGGAGGGTAGSGGTAGEGGSAGGAGAGGGDPGVMPPLDDEGGCGCRLPGRQQPGGLGAALGAGLGLLVSLGRRRRRRTVAG